MRISKHCQHAKLFSRNDPQKGFTLVEVLLVVLILSVIAGLTIPNFSRTYSRFQLKSATEDLVYLMRYAQGRAAMKSRPLRIEFNSEFSKYWLAENVTGSAGVDLGADNDLAFKRISGRFGKTFKVSGAFKIEADQSQIYFYPDGRIDSRYIYVCQEDKCFTISTKEQRGYVWMFESKLE